MAEQHELTKDIISDFADAYNSFGLNPLMGRIVALLIISPNPLSLDEITETLEMSKGPISQICRRLQDRHLIEKVWVPGDRKDYYKAATDIFGQAYKNQMSKMKRNINIAQKYIEKTEADNSGHTSFIHTKMKEMKAFYEMMDQYNLTFIGAWKEKLSKLES